MKAIPSSPPRIFIVDDHPTLIGGLRYLLEKEGKATICGEANTAATALDEILRLKPDLVVMDITLPDKSGIDLLKDVLAVEPSLKVLVFSMHDELLYAERVIRAGGKGYLVKGSDSALFLEAVREVLNGAIFLSRKVASHMVNRMAPGARGAMNFGLSNLTDRELAIFQLIGQGLSSTQIGGKLNVSPRTVDAHRNNIRVKLALPDSPSLLREAVLWYELGDVRRGEP